MLSATILPLTLALGGCAVADRSVHSELLQADTSTTALSQPPAQSTGADPGQAGTASGPAEANDVQAIPRPDPATKTADPAARDDAATPADQQLSRSPDKQKDDQAGDPAAQGGGQATTADAEQDQFRGRNTTVAWAAPFRERARPEPESVLDGAPLHGTVNLVTVREVAGRPVAEAVAAPDRDQAHGVVSAALADPEVLDVSIATTVRIQATDPYRDAQWALTRLSADKVWARQRGGGVAVAVLDTGVDTRHPDLAGVVLSGKDLVSGGSGRTDPHGHGTHVAGVIAALAGNGIGIAGLGQGVRILPVRVLGADGAGTDADVANGIVWAVDAGARVINMSVGSPDYSAAEEAAVAYAVSRGVVMVSAAGNMRAQGNPTIYPASFPGVIGVGASDTADRPTAFSSTGPGVDLLAPGVNIVSTYPPNTYAYMDGTSMSAPFVSAAAALVRAAAPKATAAQVGAVLTATARDVAPAGRDDASGHGMVRPLEAIDLAGRVASGSASLPGISAAASTPSTLSVASAPSRTRYRSLATVVFRLTVNGRPLAGAPVTMCSTAAPSQSLRCLTRRTGGTGQVALAARATGTLTMTARYAGSRSVAEAAARPVLVGVLPKVGVRATRAALTVAVNPVAPGTRVRLLKQVAGTWRTAATRTLPSSGRTTFTRLARGRIYRVAVPATDRTMAATSSAVRVR